MSNEIEDLDALIPEPRFIIFEKEQIEVPPPKTGQLLRLNTLGQKMTRIEELSPEDVDKLVDDLTVLIKNIIPRLLDKELSSSQLFALIKIVSEMAIPPDSKKLAERGITTDSPKETP